MKTKRFLVFGLPAALLALALALAGCEDPTRPGRGSEDPPTGALSTSWTESQWQNWFNSHTTTDSSALDALEEFADENLSWIENTSWWYFLYVDWATGGDVPAVPTGVAAEAWSSGSVYVTWDYALGATGYRVYRADSPYGYYSEIDTTYGVSYTDTGLSPNTTYYYKVSAWNDYGASSQSSSYGYATTQDPDDGKGDESYKPAVPTGVTAQAHSPTSISVSWNYVSGASSYRVYRSNSSNGYYSQLDTAYNTSYTDTGLSPNTTYYYKVSAWNDYGESSQSLNYGSATTQPPEEGKGEAPAAPTGVTATAQSSNSISVSWAYVSGADSYRVYRANSPYEYYSPHDTAYNTSYTDTGLSSNTTYYYKVSAYNNSAGEGEQSYSISATTAIDTLATPTNVTATAQSSNSIYVSWSQVSGASGYHVYRADSSGIYSTLPDIFGISFTNTGLLPGTTYSYRVSAYNNSGGESERSSPVSAITPLPESGTLTITVGFDLGAITINGSNGTNFIRQTTGAPSSLTLSAEGYTGVAWYVDGNTSALTYGNEITIYASDYTTKLHSVTFTGYKDGTPYAQAIPFTVLN
jgi:fibronectin type 3 domain-containing protein